MKNKKQKTKIKRLNHKDQHHFFGYYNLCPWDKKEKFFLGLKTSFIDHNPSQKESAEVILFDLKNKKQETITKTNAWCWQQGCMLQWMPPHFENKIIYNDKIKNKFVSIIMDIKTKKKKIIPFPIYSIHPSGEYALSLNFSRLYDVRSSYGYPGITDRFFDEKAPDKDGVYLVNLKTGKTKLVISLNNLKNSNYLDSMEKGKHWIDHISFSPDGKRFCFFHRWYIDEKLFHTRLYTADVDGKNLFLFPDSGFYSHIDWKDNNILFGWGSISQQLGKIRKDTNKFKEIMLKKFLPIYRRIIPKSLRKRILPVSYFFFEDLTGKTKKININNENGHSSFSPNKRYLITDTYPDSKNYRKLILYDFKENKKRIIGRFYSLPDSKYLKRNVKDFGNSSLRCDLHPKWDKKSEKISIDSVHEGFRGIYEVKL